MWSSFYLVRYGRNIFYFCSVIWKKNLLVCQNKESEKSSVKCFKVIDLLIMEKLLEGTTNKQTNSSILVSVLKVSEKCLLSQHFQFISSRAMLKTLRISIECWTIDTAFLSWIKFTSFLSLCRKISKLCPVFIYFLYLGLSREFRSLSVTFHSVGTNFAPI